MYLKLIYSLAFISFLSVYNTQAQGNSPWSLQDCLNYAKAHNLQLKVAETNIQIAKDQKTAAKGQLLPSLNGSVSQDYNIGLGIDPVTNQKKNQTTRSNNFGLGANWTLFNGFYVLNGIKKASWDVKSSEYQKGVQNFQLTLQIINDYLQILLNAEMLQAANRQLKLSQQFYKDLQIQLESGNKSKADFAEAKAQLAEDRQQEIRTESNLKIARLRLAKDLQLKKTENFHIVYELPAIIDTTLLQQPLESLYTRALKNNPEVKQRNAAVNSAESNWRMSKSNLWPAISFSAGANTLYSDRYLNASGNKIPFRQQLKDNLGQYYGFSLDIPIFNKLYSRSAIHIAKRGIEQAQLQEKQSRSDLWQDLKSIYSNAKLYKASCQASKQAEQALEEALQYAKINFKSGNAVYYDFLQARNRYLKAQSDAIQNKYQYLYNVLLLKYYYLGL